MQIPKSWPIFLRPVTGRAIEGCWRERENNKKGNQQLSKMWKDPSARALGKGELIHLAPAEILDFGGYAHSKHQACLGVSVS